jgi:addiction module RelE/StbE family toxin
MKVHYSRRALRQLDEIFTYVAANDRRAAASIVARVEALVQLIARHPMIGRPTDVPDVRVFRAAPYPYLIFYRAETESVTILRVRHTSRAENWKEGR